MMTTVRQTQRKYCSRAMVAAVIVGLGLILTGFKPIGKGLILGTLFSILNFVLMAETLPLRISKSQAKGFGLALGSIFFRYILLAIPLVLAIKLNQFNLFAVMIGLFLVQLMILADHILPARA